MYSNYCWYPELVCSWTDEQLQRLKDARKKLAQEEQQLILQRKEYETDKTLSKELKIDLLRLIKEPIIIMVRNIFFMVAVLSLVNKQIRIYT